MKKINEFESFMKASCQECGFEMEVTEKEWEEGVFKFCPICNDFVMFS